MNLIVSESSVIVCDVHMCMFECKYLACCWCSVCDCLVFGMCVWSMALILWGVEGFNLLPRGGSVYYSCWH